jgi:hypothetical protein
VNAVHKNWLLVPAISKYYRQDFVIQTAIDAALRRVEEDGVRLVEEKTQEIDVTRQPRGAAPSSLGSRPLKVEAGASGNLKTGD